MSGVYDHIRVALAKAQFNWLTTGFNVFACYGTTSFVPTDIKANQFQSRGGVIAGVSLPMLGQAVTSDGTMASGPVVIPDVVAGSVITMLLLVKAGYLTPVDADLVLFIDDVDGLPWTANGLEMVVQPDWSQEQGWWRA